METFLFIVLALLVMGSGLAASGVVLTAMIALVRAVLPPARVLPLES
jgi:hypothetical protein